MNITQQELDALPDVSAGFDIERRVVDGVTMNVPVMRAPGASLLTGPDDGFVIDIDGARWLVGRDAQGRRVKRRASVL